MKRKQTVLIVDDNPNNLSVLGSIVAENGHIPGFATSGAEALIYLKEKRPDLILLDIMMPEMDGFEVCRHLKQDSILADIPIIFLTAKTEKEDMITGLKLGAVDYVTKPFNQEELITRVNTHLELQAAKEELREALATKDKLFSVIGHDLGNLFNSLLTFAAILAGKHALITPLDAEKEGYSQDVLQLVNKGYNLLKNLLEWSRSQTGRMQVIPEIIDLQYIVQKNIQLLTERTKAKKLNLSADLDKDALVVFADVNMLDTVIRNLLSNAVKFTPTQGQIQVSSKKGADNLIEISVSDTGVGIKAENLDKLFRVDIIHTTSGTASEPGNGLGLILCKEFMEKNNGTIGVESEIGKGSRFYVRLPLEKEA